MSLEYESRFILWNRAESQLVSASDLIEMAYGILAAPCLEPFAIFTHYLSDTVRSAMSFEEKQGEDEVVKTKQMPV